MGLLERAGDRVQTYSKGMRQRLHLARGLISDPRVLFFDEPSAGMDPMAAHEFRMVLRELRAEGRTILLATHDMAEAETVCDRVTLIDRGVILATESPRSLSTMLSRFQRIECEGLDGAVLESVAACPGVTRVSTHEGTARIEVDGESVVAGVMGHLVAAGIVSLRVTRPSLEEVYLSLVGGRGLGL